MPHSGALFGSKSLRYYTRKICVARAPEVHETEPSAPGSGSGQGPSGSNAATVGIIAEWKFNALIFAQNGRRAFFVFFNANGEVTRYVFIQLYYVRTDLVSIAWQGMLRWQGQKPFSCHAPHYGGPKMRHSTPALRPVRSLCAVPQNR
jgi:hypothetical protein